MPDDLLEVHCLTCGGHHFDRRSEPAQECAACVKMRTEAPETLRRLMHRSTLRGWRKWRMRLLGDHG